MKFMQISPADVKPGMIVRAHGYRWRVTENIADGDRHVLIANHEGETKLLPHPYQTGMTLGLRNDLFFLVELQTMKLVIAG